MKLGIVAFTAASLIGMSALAAPLQTPSFAPENDLYVGVDDKSTSTITKEVFDGTLDRVQKIYKSLVEEQGGRLVMVNNWSDGKVNAFTRRSGNNWEVHMFGGLARFENMTPDGFAMVVCHELGHQLGGLPKKTSWFGIPMWASAEGQSDYFATSKCIKHYLADEDNIEYVKTLNVPRVAVEKCSEVYADAAESALCQRAAVAGEVLGTVLSAMRQEDEVISLETPDTYVIKGTNVSGYPSTQCRADTYFQGALCDVDADIQPNNTQIHHGYCSREAGYENGTRPLCWFDPANPKGLVSSYQYDYE